MRSSTLVLGLGYFLSFALADRGSAPNVPYDSTCNKEPDESPTDASRRFRRGQGGVTPAVVAGHYNAVRERSLFRRDGTVTYNDNCNDPPPQGSSYKAPDFPSKKSVLQAAYADARTLADGAKDIDGNSFAFTHYFGGEKPDVQLQHFKAMMSAIASDDKNYNIEFDCSGKGTDCTHGTSAAVTDATAGGPNDKKVIQICDRFWTSATSKWLLYRQGKTSPKPPYRDNDNGGWCAKDGNGNSAKKANFFATAGHTILHELTHLDALAAKAGLEGDPDEGNRHGTTDPQGKCEMEGARDFLTKYKQGKTEDTSPDYNAESYAGAATEDFFMKTCSFKEIKPLASANTQSPSNTNDGLPDPKCAGDKPTDGSVNFHKSDATTLINNFCGNRKYWGQVVVPAVSTGTGATSDGRHKALGFNDNIEINNGADKLYISLAFSEDACVGSFQFDEGQNDDESLKHCTDRFGKILNNCNQNNDDFPKFGGTMNDVCAIYQLTARRGDAADPTKLKSQGDLGDFVCVDTDVSALGPNSPLAGTCTCHYENVPGPTDVFKKPPSGNCKDTNKADLLTN